MARLIGAAFAYNVGLRGYDASGGQKDTEGCVLAFSFSYYQNLELF